MFRNTYQDQSYAAKYAALEWSGTYFLIARDLPAILERHAGGRRALDFGCGAGRSTRLLRACGFEVVGVDVSAAMVAAARARDPDGDYRVIAEAGEIEASLARFDLALAAFPFDNIPDARKPAVLERLRSCLARDAVLVNVVSRPAIYTHEWASFSTRDFAENATATDGAPVRCLTRGFGSQPAEDILCSPARYAEIYRALGLRIEASYQPLGRAEDGIAWVSETRIAPWDIHVVRGF